MPKKPYNFTDAEDEPMMLEEPALAYQTANHSNAMTAETSTSKGMFDNPNVPFHCTEEEFLAHIRSIEQGNFTPWEEYKKKRQQWKQEFLENRLK